MRRLPDKAIPTLRAVLQEDGTFLDRDFIRAPGIGRGTLGQLVELGWAVEIESGYPAKYRLTDVGRAAVRGS